MNHYRRNSFSSSFDFSSSSSDSFAPFPPYAMPTPTINIQMPMPDMSYVYGQPNGYDWANVSEHPYASERLSPSESPRIPEHSNTLQQSYVSERQHDIPYHASETPYPYHSEPLSPWVPEVPGQAELNPMDEPICIHTQAPRSRKPSRFNLKSLISSLAPGSSKSKS
ncbi:hypothetical protein M405DRAFT_883081 [Rhizopogon salebrosus TDB-379]|nr:hypothetical protein M405DRAFT_883081 [Rhizopogon salebrosus TDB-379]